MFVISTLHVLAHSLILGSVQHLYASYIYVLFLPASPTLFPNVFPSCVFLFSLVMSFFFLPFPPFLCPVYWEGTRTSSLEGYRSKVLSFCLFSLSLSCLGWINFFSLPDGLHHFIGDHTGYIYECVCTGYIYECIPHAHAHA